MIINVIKFTITMITLLTLMSFVSTVLSRRKMRKIETIRKEKIKEEPLCDESRIMADDNDIDTEYSSETHNEIINNNMSDISYMKDEDDYDMSDNDDDIDDDISAYMNNYTALIGRTETMKTGHSVITENTTGANADTDVARDEHLNGYHEYEKNMYRNNSYENFPVQENMCKNPNLEMLNNERDKILIQQPIPYTSPVQRHDRPQADNFMYGALQRNVPRAGTVQAEYEQGNTQNRFLGIQENVHTAATQPQPEPPAPTWNNANTDNMAYTPHIPDKYKMAADSNRKKLYF